MSGDDEERLRRWRLALGGGGDADGTGVVPEGRDAHIDAALSALYASDDPDASTADPLGAGLAASAPRAARWLGDIRRQFSPSTVQLLQRDAIDRLGLQQLLLEPELLDAVQPDVHLVATLIGLARAMPETTRSTARAVVRRLTEELEARLAARTRSAVGGALDRSARIRRPRRPSEVDWDRTVRANLRHYLPEQRTLVPERLIGRGRAAASLRRELILCVDQSGSMAPSVVHAAVFASVLASVRSLATRLVLFDTSVVDLTDQLDDPVDVLFGAQLGGGTDIARALAYCATRINRPAETVLVLVSDLCDGGDSEEALRRAAALTASGVRLIVLPALADAADADATDAAETADATDPAAAERYAALGVPVLSCPPDDFPELIAAALERQPLSLPRS
ncbi:hypothetical protein BIV57_21345 [Mangrovactinospora gilvigrisea]|uniref:VWFA domain-containing protein n=1 Tax=Mangrovactinospora gilvigrisea TaxID=1428644 RepID=A0A1J7C1M1_9ACTN|nr:hypothetical protein BIV57_21345 [Mangrovactinospora gilvigrisea]